MAKRQGTPNKKVSDKKPKTKVGKDATKETTLDGPGESAPRRRLSRRDTDAQIERVLKGAHFRHISPITLANKRVRGKTVREALRDMFHDQGDGGRNGSSIYQKLAQEYSDDDVSISCLKAADPKQPVPDALLSALSTLSAEGASGKSVKRLQLTLQEVEVLNERSLIGLVKTSMSASMQAKPNFMHITMAVMSYFGRPAGCCHPSEN